MSPQVKQRIKLAAVALAIVILLIIFLQNTEPITLNVLFQSMTLPLVAWLLLTLAIGFLLGYVTCGVLRRRKLAAVEKVIV